MKVYGYKVPEIVQTKARHSMINKLNKHGGFDRQDIIDELIKLGVPAGDNDTAWYVSDRLLRKWARQMIFVFNTKTRLWVRT